MYPTSARTVVIGGGQAGLATAFHLARESRDFVVLDAADRVGASWRDRWDSLRLLTPAEYDGLPGLPFPAPRGYRPSKDEVARYLADYAATYELPVRHGVRVEALQRSGAHFVLRTTAGTIDAERVVVATGAFQQPHVPSVASALGGDVVQLHSSAYRNPSQLPAGDVLVVGAGNAGAQIALELARSGRRVWLSGRITGTVPDRVLGRDVYWWIWEPVMQRRAVALMRVAAERMAFGGDPLIGIGRSELDLPRLARVGRTIGARDGLPVVEGGHALPVASVVWCTGFRPDFRWIELPLCDERGRPRHRRGTVPGVPGLGFVGLRFLHRLNSSLLGGVGADARRVVERLSMRDRARGASVVGGA